MKAHHLALLAAAFLPALAQAAPAQASKQQCQGYLKDSFDIMIYATTCQPDAAQDNRYKVAFQTIIEELNQSSCERVLSADEAKAFLSRQTEGKQPPQYCAAIRDSVQRSLQRYGSGSR
ncbi:MULTISPECIES: hypothetical protein [Eikenella]|uniref:Uncharacterized protein n=1 Tax=Eikenella longinqua TaxID=1795827 RepID=A0A1A9RW78_9NEIS|nr:MULTISPECIES: hypothetical protein [Eikenella]OAM26141.1 hypothetical protein A7P95_10590 [Eikenella longinqua]